MTKHQQFRQNYKPSQDDETRGFIICVLTVLASFVGYGVLLAYRG